MRFGRFASVVALSALLAAASAAASAGPAVREAVADLTAALTDLEQADAYFPDQGTPSILAAIGGYTATIVDVGKLDGAKRKYDQVFTQLRGVTRNEDFMKALRDNVRDASRGENRRAYRDQFYRQFIGTLIATQADPTSGRRLVRRLFGRTIGANLLDRYDLAVSRTRL